MAYCTISTEGKKPVLRLAGDWNVFALPEIQKEIAARALPAGFTADGAGLTGLDTSAAWYLDDVLKPAAYAGFDEAHGKIIELMRGLAPEKEIAPPAAPPFLFSLVAALGARAVSVAQDAARGVRLFGELILSLNPLRFRVRSVVFHINEIGLKAIPIIALMAFSIAFVMGYQGAFQLQKFDATVYTIDLVVLSILREMGVLITAIMVAGRSGSAFAAQLGTMKLNEEVDALRTMNVSPFEVLVLPRLIAILIALPMLTVLADTLGLIGGYVFSSSYLDYSGVQFLARMEDAADMTQFYVGLSKAPVFALLIGIVGCMQGLQARGSSEDVGRKTITAVVQSIFLVIVVDAVFSVIFTKLGV